MFSQHSTPINSTTHHGQGTAIIGLPERPKTTNKTGREVVVKLNTFAVTEYPVKPIYQYDVSSCRKLKFIRTDFLCKVMVGKGGETRGLIKKLWNSKAAKEALKSASWLFDGNKLAWSVRFFFSSRQKSLTRC